MNNDNPAEMSNDDLEKDMERRNAEDKLNTSQKNVKKSTAAEGVLKTPEQDVSSAVAHDTEYNSNEEQDLDDLQHQKAKEIHNGAMPDPEEVSNWEDRDTSDKFSG